MRTASNFYISIHIYLVSYILPLTKISILKTRLIMSIYIVSYDLKNADSTDYDELYSYLNSINSHRIQDSVWLIKTNKSLSKVKQKIKTFMSEYDRLWVSIVNDDEYTFSKSRSGTNDWLNGNM